MVQIYDKRGKNLGNFHGISTARNFRGYLQGINEVKSSGFDRINISFTNYLDANDMVDNRIKKIHSDWGAYIPDFAIVKVGLVRGVDPELSVEKITENFVIHGDPTDELIKVDRLTYLSGKKDENGQVIRKNSSRIKVFIRCNTLPMQISRQTRPIRK